jgi:hypothetical protein
MVRSYVVRSGSIFDRVHGGLQGLLLCPESRLPRPTPAFMSTRPKTAPSGAGMLPESPQEVMTILGRRVVMRPELS